MNARLSSYDLLSRLATTSVPGLLGCGRKLGRQSPDRDADGRSTNPLDPEHVLPVHVLAWWRLTGGQADRQSAGVPPGRDDCCVLPSVGREAVAALCRRACPPDCRHTTPSAAKRSQTAVAPSGLVSLKRTSLVGKPTGRALASLRDAKTAATPPGPSGMRAAVSCRTRRDKAVQRPASPAQRINTHRDKST